MFWSRLRTAWSLSRELCYFESADSLPWNDLREKAFQAFMTSPVGIHFAARMHNLAVQKAMEAVRSPQSSTWRAGVAYGVQVAIAYMESHLPEPRPAAEPEPLSEEEAAIQRIIEEASNG